MLIYAKEKTVSRFFELQKTNAQIRAVLNGHYKIVSETAQLRSIEDPRTEILVLDMTDTDVLRLLFQKEWKNVFFPVCDEILSVSSLDADRVLEQKLLHCSNWKWHKEANRFRMLRCYFLRKPVMDSLPSHIQLEHTSYCNARCIMCGHAIYENRGAEHISQQMMQRITSLLPTCELMVLHGYGEPLMTKNLDKLLELYQKYEIEVTTNTNLSYLPENILEHLAPVMKHLRVSCDAVTKEIYEKIRPGLSFEKFLQNLERLENYAPQTQLMMEVVIMRQNVEQIAQMVQFAWEHGFSQISFNRLGSHPVLNNERDCLTYYPHLTSYHLRQGIELGRKLGIKVYYPVEWLRENELKECVEEEKKRAAALPFRMQPLFCAEDQKMMIHNAVLLHHDDASLAPGTYGCSGMCDSLLGRTNLDLKGNVYACCMNTLKKVGNLFEMNDREFYNAPALVKMRELFYQGEVPAYCNACSYVMNHTLALADIKRKDI
ncbi:MAG: radical SAM/SPASM domain-containing protein [Acutalibacteraceae bacterium]